MTDQRQVKWDGIDTEEGNEECTRKETEISQKKRLVYGLEDVPPWYATILFGFQVKAPIQFYYQFFHIAQSF